jgi:hypothetical protein
LGWGSYRVPPRMRVRRVAAAFCSTGCSICWSRNSAHVFLKMRLRNGIERLLELVFLYFVQ